MTPAARIPRGPQPTVSGQAAVLLRIRIRTIGNMLCGSSTARPRTWVPIFGIAGFAAWMAWQIHWLLRFLLGFGDSGAAAARQMVESMLLGLFVLQALFAIQAVVSHLFEAKDLPLLTSLPLRDEAIYLAKLADAFFLGNAIVPITAAALLGSVAATIPGGWAFYLPWLLMIFAFLLIPLALGSVVALLAVLFIPWARLRDVFLGIGSIALAVAIFGMNIVGARVRDESWRDRWLNDLDETPASAAPAWALHRLLAGAMIPAPDPRKTARAAVPLAAAAALAAAVGLAATRALYRRGRSRFEETPAPRPEARTRAARRWVRSTGSRLPHVLRGIIRKEGLLLLREPHAWSHLIIPVLAALSIFPVLSGIRERALRPEEARMVLLMISILAAGLAGALSFGSLAMMSVGRERAWWAVAAAGISPSGYLLAKTLVYLLPALAYAALILVLFAAVIPLRGGDLLSAASWTIPLVCAEIFVAMGFAARYPEFRERSARRSIRPLAAVLGSYLMLGLAGLTSFLAVLPGLAASGNTLLGHSFTPLGAFTASVGGAVFLLGGAAASGWIAALGGIRRLMATPIDPGEPPA